MRVDAFGLDLGMMGGDGVDDEGGLAMFFEEVGTDFGVGSFQFVVHGFADVVEQTDAASEFDIEVEFGSHDAAQPWHQMFCP